MQNVLKKSGEEILLGNEAIVRGALEAGVQFVSTYPGTPASEIGDTFYKIFEQTGTYFGAKREEEKAKLSHSRASDKTYPEGIYFEFSANEKTALEAGVGASFSNLKTLVAMKNFGLNVASDALLPFLYTGSKGPTVIVVADDPSCHSSAQSEQNTRPFAFMAHIPILEPSDPQECKDFVKLAFQISKKFDLPIMVRLTTRVAHQKMPVKLSPIIKPIAKGKFIKDRHRFVTMPPRVLEMKQELLDKIEQIRQFAETNTILPKTKGKAGIITSGVSYLYVMEALQQLKIDLPVLKLNFFYPLPEKKIKKFIAGLNKVLIVEELEGFLEKEITALAKTANPKLGILGKDLLPQVGELTPDHVLYATAKLAGKRYNRPKQLDIETVKHLPRFCTGWPTCPYWKLFAAVKQAAPASTIFGGDIGCYMIAALAPHNLYDYLSCMGSSIGIIHGVKKATGQKAIAFIGDGTFFHAGIPAMLNVVYNKSNPLIIIADNSITAMTGQQPNPGSDIKIEEILRALKVQHIKVIDQEENYEQLVKTIKLFLNKKEVSVIIARHMCGLLTKRLKNKTKK